MPEECMLTTIDNPFNPFDDYESWYEFDVSHGYNTCAYLAEIAQTTDGMSEIETEREIERAIDEICRLNVTGIHRKVFETKG